MIKMIYLTALKTIFQIIITKPLRASTPIMTTICRGIKNRAVNMGITIKKIRVAIIFKDSLEMIIVMQHILNMDTKVTKRKSIVTKFTSTKEIQVTMGKMTICKFEI